MVTRPITITSRQFEWDWRETSLRFGGDLAGLESKLDYLAGMGIKAIYTSGTPWINMLWQADSAWASSSPAQLTSSFDWLLPFYVRFSGYSALDFSTLDPHWGRRDEWRSMINAVHARGMYYIADVTVATMADLLAWKGWVVHGAHHLTTPSAQRITFVVSSSPPPNSM